jgi:hypothetical protein
MPISLAISFNNGGENQNVTDGEHEFINAKQLSNAHNIRMWVRGKITRHSEFYTLSGFDQVGFSHLEGEAVGNYEMFVGGADTFAVIQEPGVLSKINIVDKNESNSLTSGSIEIYQL